MACSRWKGEVVLKTDTTVTGTVDGVDIGQLAGDTILKGPSLVNAGVKITGNDLIMGPYYICKFTNMFEDPMFLVSILYVCLISMNTSAGIDTKSRHKLPQHQP